MHYTALIKTALQCSDLNYSPLQCHGLQCSAVQSLLEDGHYWTGSIPLATDQLVLWLMVAIYPSMVAMMVAIYPSSLRHPGQAIMDPAPGARGEQPCLATSQSVSLTICLNHKMASNMASWITVPAHVSSLASRDPTVFVGTQYHVSCH